MAGMIRGSGTYQIDEAARGLQFVVEITVSLAR